MKRIKYFERCRNNRTKEFEFIEHVGWLDEVFDKKTNTSFKVVYRKDIDGWRITHFDSGLSIDLLISTRQQAVNRVHEQTMIDAVLSQLNRKDIQKYIYELNDYRNSLIIKGYTK